MHIASNLGKFQDILLMNIMGSRRSGRCHAALGIREGFNSPTKTKEYPPATFTEIVNY